MLLIFVFCLYPNFYSWWSYFNNLNDSFYQEFLHQSFFTISEFYITALTVLYLNKVIKAIFPFIISSIHLFIHSFISFYLFIHLSVYPHTAYVSNTRPFIYLSSSTSSSNNIHPSNSTHHHLSKETPMSLKKIAIAMVITLMHILSSCFDQFIANVLYFMGEKHQVSLFFQFYFYLF